MPIIESEATRKALAFWREGRRLSDIHHGFSFLSFYKVIESQFSSPKHKVDWIASAIAQLDGDAGDRVAELRAQSVDISRHLFESGRCAVAHASAEEEIVDPDIPEDRRRLSSDLVMMQELARIYIRDELQVPTARSLYRTRNRLEPWDALVSPRTLAELKRGRSIADISSLDGLTVSVGLWPDDSLPSLKEMTFRVDSLSDGVVKIVAVSKRRTIFLVFYLDYTNGRVHANLEESCLTAKSDELEQAVAEVIERFKKLRSGSSK
jgi:hypothetical protein